MPRQAKPARLHLRPARTRNGKLYNRATWVIIDGRQETRTGCVGQDIAGAERALADYLAARHDPRDADAKSPAGIPIADVLHLYLRDKVGDTARPKETAARITTLRHHFGMRTLAEINGAACRAYLAERGSSPAARRELEDLRAAINYHRKEGLCSQIVSVWLPEKSPARDRWLTRAEAARLVWSAWRHRDRQNFRAGDRRTRKHLARFILVGLYTGTRAGAICGASFERRKGFGFVDLERGVFYRRPAGARDTKKRRTPVRLPDPLLDHMRRWRANGQTFVVEWNGKPVAKVSGAFRRAAREIGLEDVTPHTLRHTAATWGMQRGADVWQLAGYLGMTLETLTGTYGHHHPDFQESARRAFAPTPQTTPRMVSR